MFFVLVVSIQCADNVVKDNPKAVSITAAEKIIVLGVAQDAGYPQASCQKECCQKHYTGQLEAQKVASISIVDTISQSYWIIDATPDFKEQLQVLQKDYPSYEFGGIFLTHAHVGHYTGLIHLGREIMGAKNIPVYAMPTMKLFLEHNGPWSQLVTLNNIAIQELNNNQVINLNNRLSVTPFIVPHRDEFSETVGFEIKGSNKSAIYIPDIDKWEKWDHSIIEDLKSVDHALLDGTFFRNGEIPGRDMSLIPHPFIEESMSLFNSLDQNEKSKISFIHFNHTNPVLDAQSDAYQSVKDQGLGIAYEGMVIDL